MPLDHPFASLAGSWRGRGDGSYPTIAPFRYVEELVVEPVPGRPIAHWRSRTRDAASDEPRHAESGFLRSTPPGIELVLAHNFGLAEVAAGTFEHGVLSLSSTTIPGTATARQVDRIERRYVFDGDRLRYTTAMAAVGNPTGVHLRASLARAD